MLTPRDDALGPGLSAPEHEAARQAAVEAGAKESNKMHVKQQKVGKGEEEARHLIKQQDQVEIRRLLMMTAKEEERERIRTRDPYAVKAGRKSYQPSKHSIQTKTPPGSPQRSRSPSKSPDPSSGRKRRGGVAIGKM